jgi:hypothetical protein
MMISKRLRRILDSLIMLAEMSADGDVAKNLVDEIQTGFQCPETTG